VKICVYNVTSTMDLPGTREVGGTEEFSFRIAETWQSLGHDVTLVGGEPRPGASCRPTTVPVRLFPYRETGEILDLGSRYRKLMQRLHFARKALPFVRGERFDLVLAFKPYDLVPFAMHGIRNTSRVVFRFGGTDFFPTDRWWQGAAHAFFANSRSTAAKVSLRFGCGCEVIPNGVELPGNPAMIDDKTLTILSAGRLVGWKGFSTLIEAMSPLRSRKNVRMVIAGEGEERPRLEALIDELGLKQMVSLPGRLSGGEIRALMAKGALYVQPSIGYDSCPNAVMEAMAAGLPVVISSQVGTLEGFEAGRHGIVFGAGDHQALCEPMVRFLDGPAEFALFGAEARKLVRERAAPERVAEKILELAGR
jgi:glycosyltransferase involved in cell wall biosynthesis